MAGRTKHQELLCHQLSSQLQSQVPQVFCDTEVNEHHNSTTLLGDEHGGLV